ncbi:hypothetical protein CYLTODRAFT_490419 [Cylindrobasidium torrendii FP15055 ss-10]|uniref:Uncharacterized protein n=1 Tax=Cylindrobasidium torrendii FP15055 ss-10 TaxID=1314674 RepID=A0A0D7BAV1_9AGAR|nr:hypothetical protein CYLTODRAFT_490419 [Cylindrobasidium torrendii FP15055 ss-10]
MQPGVVDPSYSTKTSQHPRRIYKDCKGDMHDPDYRHFPLVSTYSPSFGSMQNTSAVEEEEYEDPFSPMRRSASISRSPRATRRSLSLHRDDQPSPSPAAPMTFVVPTSSPPSSPSMPTSSSPWKRRGRRPAQPPHQITALDSYFEGAAEEEQESEYDSSEDTEQDNNHTHPRSPGGNPDLSRSESVKRQLQSMSLSVNIKVFRFRRALGARGLQLGLGGTTGDGGRSAAY